MKNLFYLISVVLTLTVLISCQEEEEKNPNQFTLQGEITGLTGNLYFRNPEREYSRENPADSIIVKDGKFSFTDTISQVTLMRAFTDYEDKNNKLYKRTSDNSYIPTKSMYLMFYAFPGADITVKGEATDFIDAYPGGDIYNNSLAEINKIAYPYYNESVNLRQQSAYEKDSIKIQQLTKEGKDIGETGRLSNGFKFEFTKPL